MVLEGCGATTRACCAMRLPRRTLSTDMTITGIVSMCVHVRSVRECVSRMQVT